MGKHNAKQVDARVKYTTAAIRCVYISITTVNKGISTRVCKGEAPVTLFAFVVNY